MKIDFGPKEYLAYGAKKFCLYFIIGLLVSNIPIPFIGMIYGSIAIFISALAISIADTMQIKAWITTSDHRTPPIVFSSSYKKIIIVIFLVTLIYVIYLKSILFTFMDSFVN